MTENEYWQMLVKVSVLGTAVRDESTLPEDRSLSGLFEKLEHPGESRERKLLKRAAALSMVRKSRGGLTLFGGDLPLPCAQDSRADAPPHAISLLRQLISENTAASATTTALIGRWLELCGERHRVPAMMLPALMDRLKAKKNSNLHRLLAKSGGKVFDYLCASNQDWAVYSDTAQTSVAALTRVFELGEKAERLEAFSRLRELDAALALEKITTYFKKEPADVRKQLLSRMATTLSIADLPFIEEALSDKSSEVRQEAYRLATVFPQSSIAARLSQVAAQLLKADEKGLKIEMPQSKVVEALNIEFDEINSDLQWNQGKSTGKTTLLARVVSRLSPETIQTLFPGYTEADIARVASANEQWGSALLQGLLQSILHFAPRMDPKSLRVWQKALLAVMGESLGETEAEMQFQMRLPRDLLEELLLRKMPRWSGAKSAPRMDFWTSFHRLRFAWSAEFSTRVFDFILKEAREKVPALDYNFRSVVSHIALDMDISQARRASQLTAIQREGEQSEFFIRPLNDLAELLELRLEIEKSFAHGEEHA